MMSQMSNAQPHIHTSIRFWFTRARAPPVLKIQPDRVCCELLVTQGAGDEEHDTREDGLASTGTSHGNERPLRAAVTVLTVMPKPGIHLLKCITKRSGHCGVTTMSVSLSYSFNSAQRGWHVSRPRLLVGQQAY